MKTHQHPIAPNIATIIRFSAGFIFMVLFFSSCEKSNLEYIDAPIASIDKVSTAEPIQFSLVLTHCFAGGANVTVDLDNPEKYTFRWEVNGEYKGQNISTDACGCGGIAKVTITRLSDKKSISESVGLPACKTADTQ